ncbi:MAG: GTPase Era [Elainellaceae cyanobacterium]
MPTSASTPARSAVIPPSPPGFRSGFVGIVGRPNVGKSTLMNRLVGQKIAITSPVAQTTRNRLQGILTLPQAQLIFVDTPGIHKPHHQLGKVLVQNARTAVSAVDVVVLTMDGSGAAGRGDRFIVDLVAQTSQQVILGLNKIDRCSDEEVKASYEAIAQEHQWPLVEFSALTGENVDGLLNHLVERLEPGPYYYPPDLVTDQPERFIMGELIREQILLQTREEIPHAVAISIDRVDEEPAITRILATIHVERMSQKGILIGKGGSKAKQIGTAAREQIQKLVMGKVYLELFVRVQAGWRQSRAQLAEFGYSPEE